MIEFEISTIINKPIEIVDKALINPRNHVYWTTNLVEFEVVKETPDMVGSIGYMHYRNSGRTYMMEDKLLVAKPMEKYVSQVSGNGLLAYVETELEKLNDKTKIKIKWKGKGKTLLLKIIFLFAKNRMIKQSKKELRLFKELVETRGINFDRV